MRSRRPSGLHMVPVVPPPPRARRRDVRPRALPGRAATSRRSTCRSASAPASAAPIAAREALGLRSRDRRRRVGARAAPTPLSFAAGRPVRPAGRTRIADGMACRAPDAGGAGDHLARRRRASSKSTEDEIARGDRASSSSDTHNVAEGAGAAPSPRSLKERDAHRRPQGRRSSSPAAISTATCSRRPSAHEPRLARRHRHPYARLEVRARGGRRAECAAGSDGALLPLPAAAPTVPEMAEHVPRAEDGVRGLHRRQPEGAAQDHQRGDRRARAQERRRRDPLRQHQSAPRRGGRRAWRSG